MPLNLYRRHYRAPGKCVGGHPPDSRSYEAEELRRNWKKCYCPIYADGTLGGKFNRRNIRKVLWPEAKAVAAEWEARGSWDETETPAPAPGPPPEPPKPSITIEFATDAYLVMGGNSNALKARQMAALPLTCVIALNGARSRSVPVRGDLGRGLDESTAATGDRLLARREPGPARTTRTSPTPLHR
jgi:hypothetical protein